MPGSIIPAPFAIPPMRTFVPSSSNSTAFSLETLSLVMIATAVSFAFFAVAFKPPRHSRIPAFTFVIGSAIPIRPVEQTRTSSSGRFKALPTWAHMARASFSPRSPVQALAFPEFTTIACADALDALGSLTLTGAAQTWFVVNMPATAAGASDTINAMSLLADEPLPSPAGLMPQCAPAERKPFGAFTEPLMIFKQECISKRI